MSNAQERGPQSIDQIAKDIVNNDPSNGKGRPGKTRSTGTLLKRPLTWGLLVVIVAIVVVVIVKSGSSTPGGPKTNTTGKTGNFASYVCHGTQTTLFSNINSDAVSNGGSQPSFSTHGKAYCLMYIQTYHWNKGTGSPPGTVGLVRVSGPAALAKYVSSLPAKATDQNGVPNVNLSSTVSISKPVVLDGEYSCTDSDPSTWSSDKASGGAGFCLVYANLALPPGN
jgi:hypothetical protein